MSERDAVVEALQACRKDVANGIYNGDYYSSRTDATDEMVRWALRVIDKHIAQKGKSNG